MKIINWNKASAKQQKEALRRPRPEEDAARKARVARIIGDVRASKDKALLEFTSKFDGVRLKSIRVSSKDVETAANRLDPALRKAMRLAMRNIEKFHRAEYPANASARTMPGVFCSLQWRPIEKVGLYIPAGTAPLFSALLMQAIPARIAGCPDIILCSPAQKNGKVHSAILAAARLCGIKDVFAVGGAQAVAAMAYGTETVPKVDKIFGPGNAYVTAAKQLVSEDPMGAAIDIPAGQSEVLVIADNKARPDWVASDLLAQAEHDALSQVILITTSATFAKTVWKQVETQLKSLPRKAIAMKCLAQSRMIIVPTLDMAVDVSNIYAPEHLIINSPSASRLLPRVKNAGSVFLGPFTPESAGDYASGTNHVLPTYGWARAYGGLSVLSFMKSMTVQRLTQKGLNALGPAVITMAEAEGLQGHANAVKVRMGIA